MKYQRDKFAISRLEFIMQLYVPLLGYFFGRCKWNQISTPAFSSVFLQSVLVISMAWKPIPASNASPEHTLLQFQLITACFIHRGCGKLTKLSLQMPFMKYFLQTKTSVFPDWKATLAGVVLGEVPQTTLYPSTVWQQKKDLLSYSGIKYSHAFFKNNQPNNPPSTSQISLAKIKLSSSKHQWWKNWHDPPTKCDSSQAVTGCWSCLPVTPAGNFFKLLYISPAYVWWNLMYKTNPFFPILNYGFSLSDFIIFFTNLVTQP